MRWFLTAFFVASVVVIATTWWRKSAACEARCAADGNRDGRLELSGGGRLSMSVVCRCVSQAP